MPTGYTADVQSGEITELQQFALSCARAFGALIEMRDEPNGVPIPERFEPSPWPAQQLEEARKRLARLKSLSDAEVVAEAAAALVKAKADAARRAAERDEHRNRYNAMLEKVTEWTPPSPEHVEFKGFMAQQLRDSIEFDCSASRSDEVDEAQFAPVKWMQVQIARALWDISYQEKEVAAETERVEKRNRWIADLRASLASLAALPNLSRDGRA